MTVCRMLRRVMRPPHIVGPLGVTGPSTNKSEPKYRLTINEVILSDSTNLGKQSDSIPVPLLINIDRVKWI